MNVFKSLFQGVVDWFVGLTEAAAVIAAVLFIGLVVGVSGFWMLSHGLGKLAGPSAELDPYEDEPDERDGTDVVSICPDDNPPRRVGNLLQSSKESKTHGSVEHSANED
jgi:hypothetical protein